MPIYNYLGAIAMVMWQRVSDDLAPADFVTAVQAMDPEAGNYTAQLLWQRGYRDIRELSGFFDPGNYTPTSALAFPEMAAALARLQQAQERQEKVVIWGDFDADGVTATAVLWQGLGQFFTPHTHLTYYIPNRLKESHGLSKAGLESLAQASCQLIITCDTGSSDATEIAYAQTLGMDVIVTDHHTMPTDPLGAIALINSRQFPQDHPLRHLSGVAVAYKLIEALYHVWPEQVQEPLDHLLDLVAIGLIADLVELRGDCRYLAQRGIAQLQKSQRPGIRLLLDRCKAKGDRATDIGFGLGPRINAVSRIYGDAGLVVDLLTSKDEKYCRNLVNQVELANDRRKALQKDVFQDACTQVERLDLSTTRVIILMDDQWPAGVLGLVAGQLTQEYGRPVILLNGNGENPETAMAAGSARSYGGIDLYELFHSHGHLLDRYGGHPFAAGLRLPVRNISLLQAALNQSLGETLDIPNFGEKVITIDLEVKVHELGQALFRELYLLEPYGMGNPVPKLLLKNVTLTKIQQLTTKDSRGKRQNYSFTTFEFDRRAANLPNFDGIAWNYKAVDFPKGPCDLVIELGIDAKRKVYQARVIDIHPSQTLEVTTATDTLDWLWDYRQKPFPKLKTPVLMMRQCPQSWQDWRDWFQRAQAENLPLMLAYPLPQLSPPEHTWRIFVGTIKYLSHHREPVSRSELKLRLNLGDRSLDLGLRVLLVLGIHIETDRDPGHRDDLDIIYRFTWPQAPSYNMPSSGTALEQFFEALREEQFRYRYFGSIPLNTLKKVLSTG
ncbi:single-stranded-DNA-specific exonuclease RecJ [Candidatus Synechococcus calcipolaris G9]|uniref:Single-stranded-DNA-specific exonuclease RecJ n=1 Tax=Candidatus Synechococcus calcipolaris G9 TaxID=1497997 RepID=A0ABT6EXX0_9SYNE|nr:single-stranded-DNA-specific exonuclease RecJ [Candidatus Synechococcus calcipolaris]MDG2990657.1 single-stranded-DNA-specific exonuclease RecJ [Candidatus Synechococcus calcipolaris G9]